MNFKIVLVITFFLCFYGVGLLKILSISQGGTIIGHYNLSYHYDSVGYLNLYFFLHVLFSFIVSYGVSVLVFKIKGITGGN